MKILLLIILLSVSLLRAQVVYEPLYDDIYNFLDRLSQKGIIELDDNILPLTRIYIAEKLYLVELNKNNLNSLEKEELNFYLKDYSLEINKFILNSSIKSDSSNFLRKEQPYNTESKLTNGSENSKINRQITFLCYDQYKRWRLFDYSDDLFKINFSPILGYETGTKDREKNTHTWSGIRFYGYLKDYIGFSFDYRDNSESGKNIDRTKNFTEETGIIIARNSESKIDYSEIRTNLSVNWSWGSVSLGKDFLEWGYGESGKLVLSDKAPSFPFIRLDIKPVDWLSFNYFHAWLSSDIIDSNETYFTNSIRTTTANRIIYRDKYLASHSLNIFPLQGLTLSLGESVIYSDKLEIAYMMPLMFFRLADHYLSNANNNSGSNSQFFFGISSRNQLKNTHLYGTLFIDEITLTGLFDSYKQRNQFGFTLGGSATDLPIENLSLTCEYTKIYPFVYTHYIPTQTYTSSSYNLGHWIGNNADLIYGSLNYRILRGLQTTIWGEYIRKGDAGLVDQQYTQPQPPFLFGLKTKYFYGGAEIKYEIIHDMFLRGQYQYNKTSQEQIAEGLKKNQFGELHFALYYGL